jgi:hypothetical protein
MATLARDHPSGGRYERTLAWLGKNPGSTLDEISYAMECTRERSLQILRYGLQENAVRRERASSRLPWRWYRAA